MPTHLRPNDIQTSVGDGSSVGAEEVILKAVQPTPDSDQEATIIIVTIVNLTD